MGETLREGTNLDIESELNDAHFSYLLPARCPWPLQVATPRPPPLPATAHPPPSMCLCDDANHTVAVPPPRPPPLHTTAPPPPSMRCSEEAGAEEDHESLGLGGKADEVPRMRR